ncbi:hypothetical protein PHZ_c0175 [Phenylobacterium zucineum HLK1]|uniref:GmrSD restriction endonucleases N-terminal domain-containing protein n=1 Tax=Phenylobacterium zucineum (strain HLK1) TaxID=450851 RepID=B4RCJ0_PHEZH|nr:DUF262 domain-containing protein [Phenylobacterium zucineum]ACG76589.1 hypothetical protein PHZ_c0175 [Phenylobacterium zucineum HLK1]
MRSDKRELDKIFKRRDRYEIPDWQRDEVWDVPRKQKLIDSILRGWRLPKFYFVVTGPQTYEVVDGQQRLSTIFEFLSGELTLSEQTAEEFGGATYAELPADISDQVDDFEIDFDEISDASDDELMDFFQRLQSGLQLNSSEKLNAVPGKLKDFCKKSAKHKFFKDCVAFSDRRYAHFDVMAKVATLEVEGPGTGLRYQDVKQVFESNAGFSEQSQVAKRIKAALDLLAGAVPVGSKTFRSRSITQSFITMVCHLQKTTSLKGKEQTIGAFAEHFVKSLAAEVEKGQDATDVDLIAFQKSVNANVKAGPIVRQQVLLRKLFQFAPDFLDAVDPQALAGANFSGEIASVAKAIRADIQAINEAYAGTHGSDLFKATSKTAEAQAVIGEPATNYDAYKTLVDNMYFLFWEGPGPKIDRPASFKDVNALRTELQHDTDHGNAKDVAKKKMKNASVFQKYAGTASPLVAAPARFQVLQLNLLREIRNDLQAMLAELA